MLKMISRSYLFNYMNFALKRHFHRNKKFITFEVVVFQETVTE